MITKKKLEKFGFNVTKTSDGYEIQQYTPAGEDWNLYAKTIKEFEEVFRNFDEEAEFEMWVEAKAHSHPNMRNSIPSYPELWGDQLWKKELCEEILR